MRTSKSKFLLLIVSLLITSDVGACLVIPFSNLWYTKFEQTQSLPTFSFLMEFVAMGLREIGFKLAYWLFAYKYWITAL